MTKKQEQEIKRIYRFVGKETAIVFVCQNLKCKLSDAQHLVETICEEKEGKC